MQFLADLNGATVFLTGLSVVLAAVFLRALWGSYSHRWPHESAGVLALLLGVAGFCFVSAYDAYCPDADQPHIGRTGPMTPFKRYFYDAGGRHSSRRTGLLVCVGPCNGDVPLMEFDEQIMNTLAGGFVSHPLTVTYLGRKEPADMGNGMAITAHPVVEIDDADTQERIFYIDTTRHWPRVFVLLTDALVCFSTFGLCIRRMGSDAQEDDEGSSRSVRDGSAVNDLTSLGLESHGRDKG
jgi:hypothetical protein